MARPTLRHHRKFRHLSRLLGNSPALAWGTLELVWHVAYECGDPRIGTAADVEDAACWRGKRGTGAAALLESGFLDYDEATDTYTVHDLDDHAPDYVAKRRRREAERCAGVRQTAAERRTNGGQTAAERWPNGSTPSPSPSPTRSPTPTQVQTPIPPPPAESATRLRRVNGTAAHLDGFEDFWAAYPKKRAKLDAERAWAKLAPGAALQAEILAGVAAQARTEDWLKQGGQFIPNPATFLNGRRWTDRPTEVPRVMTRTLRAAVATADFTPPEDVSEPDTPRPQLARGARW